MARTEARSSPSRAPRRECESASNKVARVRSAGILLPQLVQRLAQQSPAISAPVQQRTRPERARQQCQRDRFQQLQWPAMGSTRTPKPDAIPAGCGAEDRTVQKRLRNRKSRMLLLAQTSTPEERSPLERITARRADMGSADPDCSSCEFGRYATL